MALLSQRPGYIRPVSGSRSWPAYAGERPGCLRDGPGAAAGPVRLRLSHQRDHARPIADAVPSTNEFEMYPVGLTSIASYLSANHYNVRIVKLAYLMLRRRDFDVEAYLARLRPKMFGIDLHWLPHAQGALATAEMIKRHHPATPVLMGGLSASYYHTELAACRWARWRT